MGRACGQGKIWGRPGGQKKIRGRPRGQKGNTGFVRFPNDFQGIWITLDEIFHGQAENVDSPLGFRETLISQWISNDSPPCSMAVTGEGGVIVFWPAPQTIVFAMVLKVFR